MWLVRVEWGTRFESDHLSAFIYDWKPVFGDKLLDDGVGFGAMKGVARKTLLN